MSKNNKRFSKSKMMITTLIMVVMSIFYSNSAQAGGEETFQGNCAMCHKLSSQKLVGPGLGAINEKRSEEWFVKWVTDPQGLIDSGDEQAVAVHKENGGAMPGFAQLSEDDIKGIYAFITEKSAATETPTEGETASTSVAASGSDSDSGSNNTTAIFWGIVIALILGVYLLRTTRKVRELAQGSGAHTQPHYIPSFGMTFLSALLVAGVIIYLLYRNLDGTPSTLTGLLFGAFPYVALGIFLVGSIYRWTKKGYKVSSLSTQFIEGRKLFWGSQPFHWGLLVLFFGHLTAFLFPSAVLAWNGEPMRLLILEISSFAFALGALAGLILLIKRRLTTKTLLVVTNKMDMVIYTVLLVQILSGLGVAFFVRWGSSWFASALTPYLRSVLTFNPDTSVLASAPIFVQLHVISAFLIIALIPFSRFMHFLVAPVDYLWRKYQIVVWNWNRKSIRQSTRHTFGKKPRNH